MFTSADLLWIAAFWIVGLVAVVLVARWRDTEPGAAIGASLLLSPIVGLLFAFFSKPRTSPSAQVQAPPVDSASARPTTVLTMSSPNRGYCPQCGQARTGARFCATCGLDLWRSAAGTASPAPPASPPPSAVPARQGTSTNAILAIGAVLALAGLVIAFVLVPRANVGGASGNIPPAGEVWFGSSFDPNTLSLSGHTQTVGVQQGFAIVAHLSRPVDGSTMVLRIYFNGSLVTSRAANAKGTADVWGFSAGPLFQPGRWRWEFADIGGNVLASGEVTAQ